MLPWSKPGMFAVYVSALNRVRPIFGLSPNRFHTPSIKVHSARKNSSAGISLKAR